MRCCKLTVALYAAAVHPHTHIHMTHSKCQRYDILNVPFKGESQLVSGLNHTVPHIRTAV